MITKIFVNNFKNLDMQLDLSSTIVFVGPNNSGKTSALQAISLWNFGLKKWIEARKTKTSKAKKRTGVPINRKDLYNIPVPSLKQLWKNLQVRELKKGEKRQTKNIKIKILAEGIINQQKWKVGLEFDYANIESCYVKPYEGQEEDLKASLNENIVFLPPMSGLSYEEYKLEIGTINVLIGQGKTADVLRNLCWYVKINNPEKWEEIVKNIEAMFGMRLNEPEYDPATGKIILTYKEKEIEYDLINGGRGFHQVLLILSYLYANPCTIFLIDEPDAHLEVLRQKQTFSKLYEILRKEDSQLIIATHSEALLEEASQKADIVAFLGKPHIVSNISQILKSLKLISFEQYLLAEQKGWILYLEGPTDLDILKEFAKLLNHPVLPYLERPFVKYTGNIPEEARKHFYGLKEAVEDLKGIALYDKIDKELKEDDSLVEIMWRKKEIENYLPLPEVLERYFEKKYSSKLFTFNYLEDLKSIIIEEVPPAALKDKNHNFWSNTKISDDFLEKILVKFSKQKNILPPLNKREYYMLVEYANAYEIDEEVKEKLDIIYEIAKDYEKY